MAGSVQVRGISGRIDGCEGLHKQANTFHTHLPQEHKRWIDLEDILQEGLLAAWQAEQKYAVAWGPQSKDDKQTHAGKRPFSTYMAYGVRNQFSQTFRSPLQQQKRLSNGVASISDPVPGTDDVELGSLLPADDLSPEMLEMGVSAFRAIGSRLGGHAAAFFVCVMVYGVWPRKGMNGRMRMVISDIRHAALAVGNGFEEMIVTSTCKLFREKTLTLSLEFTKMTTTGGRKLKVLDCVGCRKLFSLTDVEQGKFEPETLTCSDCYKKMASKPPSLSCFGKVKTQDHEGFDENDPECKLHCMDRQVCKQFVQGGRMGDTQILDDEDIEIGEDADASALDEVETEKPAKAATKKATKTAKPKAAAKPAAKPAKTATKKAAPAKPAKASTKKATLDNDEEDKRDLPFKRKSVMRYSLTQALKGIKVATLEQKLKDNGYNVAFQMKMLRSGQSNGKGLMPYPVTHTWKITEEKGVIKAHDVKRIATYDKLERVYASKKPVVKKAKAAVTKKPKAKATTKKK